MAKKTHSENTVGPWARQKLDGLQAYLHGYTTALKNQNFELIYIDAFAGAGKSRIRDAWAGLDDDDLLLFDDEFIEAEDQFIEGSPLRALNLENPFARHYFFDADAGRAKLLSDLKADHQNVRIDVEVGDGNKLIQHLSHSLQSRNIRGVAFLDPYGPHLHWKTIEALARTENFEVIINFPLGMAINRLITRSGEIPDSWRADLNNCFGGEEWEPLVYADQMTLFGDLDRRKVDDAAARLLSHYTDGLQSLFGHVGVPSVVRNTRGSPIYYMLWAGPHPLGLKIANHILKQGERIQSPSTRR